MLCPGVHPRKLLSLAREAMIAEGKLLLMVDVPGHSVEAVKKRVGRDHPKPSPAGPTRTSRVCLEAPDQACCPAAWPEDQAH